MVASAESLCCPFPELLEELRGRGRKVGKSGVKGRVDKTLRKFAWEGEERGVRKKGQEKFVW